MPLLSGCDAAVLNPKGIIAHNELHLMVTAVLLMLIIVVPVIVLTLVIARRYRASNTKATYKPDWSHNNLLEFVWWIIPIAIIAVLATITWVTTHKLDPYRTLTEGGEPMKIEVIALEWRWMFIYPEQNIATINYVQFPVDRQVQFLITGDAPMNSFMIQQLAGQIYAMTGMQTQLHLIANEVGTYKGISANFSGNGFSGMTFVANVTSDADFNKWVASVKQSNNPLDMNIYNQLAKPSEDSSKQLFSVVKDDVYHNVINKYLKPQSALQDTTTVAHSN